MNKSKIPATDADRATPRDEGSLIHQRAVLLTHQETIQRHLAFLNRGLDIGTVLVDGQTSKEEKRELQTAVDRVARLDKAKKKKEDEIQRKALLTPEELDQEKREKAQQAAARKQKKMEQDERARNLVKKHKTSQ